MVEAVGEHLLPGSRRPPSDPSRRRLLARVVRLLRWGVILGGIALLGWGLVAEARSSYLQSRLLSRWTADMTFELRPGPSDAIRFPDGVLMTNGWVTRVCLPLSPR